VDRSRAHEEQGLVRLEAHPAEEPLQAFSPGIGDRSPQAESPRSPEDDRPHGGDARPRRRRSRNERASALLGVVRRAEEVHDDRDPGPGRAGQARRVREALRGLFCVTSACAWAACRTPNTRPSPSGCRRPSVIEFFDDNEAWQGGIVQDGQREGHINEEYSKAARRRAWQHRQHIN
jgi:hypothetical protein